MNRLCLSLGVLLGAISPALGETSGILTGVQQEVITRSIDQLSSPEERDLASGWSDAKKVAEFICRPVALPTLQKWDQDADRVFLGSDDADTLTLENSQLLRGSGDVRTGNDWTSFEFVCELDPASGKALSFATDLTPKTR